MPLVCDDCLNELAIYKCKICGKMLCETCADIDHKCLEKWKFENYDEI